MKNKKKLCARSLKNIYNAFCPFKINSTRYSTRLDGILLCLNLNKCSIEICIATFFKILCGQAGVYLGFVKMFHYAGSDFVDAALLEEAFIYINHKHIDFSIDFSYRLKT